jgi:presqualene diphosphate synthase
MAAVESDARRETPGNAAPELPAAGSSFYTAMRILPAEQRQAMYAIYSFCRAVDDIADDEGPRGPRRAALQGWREDVDRLFEGKTVPATADLAEPTRRYGLRREDFHAVIDGMAMDLEANLHAPDWATLDLYCDRVASAVGRLSVRVFGMAPEAGDVLAHHLGRALQLTNILRDLDEDAERGRLYLPREALREAGIAVEGRAADDILRDAGLDRACEEVAGRAGDHFKEAARIMEQAPRRAVRAPRLMEAAYRQILGRLTSRGWAPPREPVKVSKLRLLGPVLRYGIV